MSEPAATTKPDIAAKSPLTPGELNVIRDILRDDRVPELWRVRRMMETIDAMAERAEAAEKYIHELHRQRGTTPDETDRENSLALWKAWLAAKGGTGAKGEG